MDGYAKTFTALWPTVAAETQGIAPTDTIRPSLTEQDESETMEVLLPAASASSAVRAFGQTLGEGGMGIVRVAEQSSMQRQVAVKSLRTGVASPAIAHRLLQEAWVTGYLEHPNIVPVYDIAESEDGGPVILMKRIEGRTWQQLIGEDALIREHFDVRDVHEWHLRILLTVCNAVHFAHQHGVLHRDIKPDNVMIGRFGEVYLLDWGIAVALDERHGLRLRLASREKRLAGTPRYMAPEMAIADGPAFCAATDVYLLASTLYAVLTGSPPHQGDDLEQLLYGIIAFEPDHPAIPRALVPILRTAMEAEPEERYESAEAFAHAIREYLDRRGSVALAERAQADLVDLEAAVVADADEARGLFAQIRFACLQALDEWPQNEAAATTLRRAHELAVDHALARRSAEAARTALAELDDPAREARVRALEADLAREAEELSAFRVANDPTVAARGRTLFLVLMVASWFIMPVLGQLRGGATWGSQLTSSVSVLLFLGLIGGFLRRSLTATEFNRRSALALLSIPLGQFALDAALYLHGVTPAAALSARHALWAVIGLMYALLVAPGLLPAVAVIAAMAVVGAYDPAHAYLWSLVSNVALLTNAVVLWRKR
ncbi:MAG: serine/threonine protein kinase [Deltaproteobacteria bacterium]|nr:MAG: serine/threonine protein kinase [Deltaproteobacteria bacterium]